MNNMELGRMNKALDKVYHFNTGIMTLREYLDNNIWVRKSVHIRNHSSKRVQLEYKKIKDTYTYTLWNSEDSGIDVPKMLYETYNLPETIHDNRF